MLLVFMEWIGLYRREWSRYKTHVLTSESLWIFVMFWIFVIFWDFRHILGFSSYFGLCRFLLVPPFRLSLTKLVITRILLRVYRVDSQSMCYCQPNTDPTPLIPSTVNPLGDPVYSEENEEKSVGRSSQHR